MPAFRKHWPDQMPILFGTVISFCFILYAVLYPGRPLDSSELLLVGSLLGFLYFLKKIL